MLLLSIIIALDFKILLASIESRMVLILHSVSSRSKGFVLVRGDLSCLDQSEHNCWHPDEAETDPLVVVAWSTPGKNHGCESSEESLVNGLK